MSTAERIRLPDDCTIGYIVEALLGVPLIRSGLFHSHLESLQQVPASELHEQVAYRGRQEAGRGVRNGRPTPRFPRRLLWAPLSLPVGVPSPTAEAPRVRGVQRGWGAVTCQINLPSWSEGGSSQDCSPRQSPTACARQSWGCWGPSQRDTALSTQVTLSYGMFENKRNAVLVKGPFSVEADPSR